MDEKETVPNTFYEVRTTMILKPDKDISYTQENYRAVFLTNKNGKIINRILAN